MSVSSSTPPVSFTPPLSSSPSPLAQAIELAPTSVPQHGLPVPGDKEEKKSASHVGEAVNHVAIDVLQNPTQASTPQTSTPQGSSSPQADHPNEVKSCAWMRRRSCGQIACAAWCVLAIGSIAFLGIAVQRDPVAMKLVNSIWEKF